MQFKIVKINKQQQLWVLKKWGCNKIFKKGVCNMNLL